MESIEWKECQWGVFHKPRKIRAKGRNCRKTQEEEGRYRNRQKCINPESAEEGEGRGGGGKEEDVARRWKRRRSRRNNRRRRRHEYAQTCDDGEVGSRGGVREGRGETEER